MGNLLCFSFRIFSFITRSTGSSVSFITHEAGGAAVGNFLNHGHARGNAGGFDVAGTLAMLPAMLDNSKVGRGGGGS